MSSVDTDGSQLRTTRDGVPGPPGEQTDRIDDIFEILRNRRRRCMLRYLIEMDGAADFRDLVEIVTAWEEDVPVDEITYDQRKRVYIALHQTHVPKLERLGMIDHDSHSGTVTLTDEVTTLKPFLDLAESATTDPDESTDGDGTSEPESTDSAEGDRRWSPTLTDVALGVGLLGAAAAGLSAASVTPFALVSGTGYAVALGAFLVGVWVMSTLEPGTDGEEG